VWDDCSPFARVAEWADDAKVRLGDDGPQHSVKVRDSSRNSTLVLDRDCPHGDCIVGAITKYSGILRSLQTKRWELSLLSYLYPWLNKMFGDEEKESLMFHTHLIGDLHQPLHCGGRLADNAGEYIKTTFFDYYWEGYRMGFIVCRLPSWLENLLEDSLALVLACAYKRMTEVTETFLEQSVLAAREWIHPHHDCSSGRE